MKQRDSAVDMSWQKEESMNVKIDQWISCNINNRGKKEWIKINRASEKCGT